METDGDVVPAVSSETASKTKPFRVKTYPSTYLGPFVVFFRKKEKPINVLLIASEVYKIYKSVKEIKKISLDKLRIVFGSRDDANALLESKLFFNSYRVYAPCDSCEINGIIYDESLECDKILNRGSGVFKNKAISPVKILDCVRLSKLTFTDKESSYSHSNCIKITFEGTVLPDYVVVDNVEFDVRLFYPKIMHCDRCLLFGHTSQFCSNKAKCSKCGGMHSSSECNKHSDVCIHCSKKHNYLKECSVYIDHQKQFNLKIKNKNKLSYSQIVKSSDNITSDNIFAPLSHDVDSQDSNGDNNIFVYKPPIKRKRNSKKSNTNDGSSNPQPSTSYDVNFPPMNIPNSPRNIPGFQKDSFTFSENKNNQNTNDSSQNNGNTNDSNSILNILEDLVEFLGINDFWKKLIKKLLPFLATFLEKLNSFGPLISSLFC